MNQWMLEGSLFVPGPSRPTAGRHLSLAELGPSAGARIDETEGLVGERKAAFVWWGRKVTVSPCLPDVSASAYALLFTYNKFSFPPHLGAIMAFLLFLLFHSSGVETRDQSKPLLIYIFFPFHGIIGSSVLPVFRNITSVHRSSWDWGKCRRVGKEHTPAGSAGL